MINQPTFDQDDDVLMLNPSPERAALDEDEYDTEEAEFDGVGSGAASGYGGDDLEDIEEEGFDNADDLDEDLDDDSIDDDLDDDSME